MNEQVTQIYETEAYGCHITLEQLGAEKFHATVSYQVYNALGVHIASPQWGDVGTGEEIYLFVLKTVARAQNVNKPSIHIDLPCLQAPQSETIEIGV